MMSNQSRSRVASGRTSSFVLPLLLAAAILSALGAVLRSAVLFPWLGSDGKDAASWHPIPETGTQRRTQRRTPSPPLSFLNQNTNTNNPSAVVAAPRFERTKHTFESFVIGNGIDLAPFGLEERRTRHDNDNDNDNHETSSIGDATATATAATTNVLSFELFSDFDLRSELRGNETWIELLEYRRDATHPTLSFYVDKVAFKRWLVASHDKLGIESIRSFVLAYASELLPPPPPQQAEMPSSSPPPSNFSSFLARTISGWLPTDKDYAAKPTHLSCSGGVWLVHTDASTNTTYEKCGRTVKESHALMHVRPGIVVEERFAQPSIHSDDGNGNVNADNDNDNEAIYKGGMEFKVFTIWGRAWLTVWRPGTDGVHALLFRNGTSMAFDPPAKKNRKSKTDKDKHKHNKKPTPPPSSGKQQQQQQQQQQPVQLPDWIDWDRVISIGETLGRNKDMFRTDIFVGVVAGGNTNNNTSTNDNTNAGQRQQQTVRYVVSETEIHPTPLRGFEQVFEEAGRLWLAGYYLLEEQGKLAVVPNTEVPDGFYGRHGTAR
eukprot:jgi/Psemu1/293509/fgenesh1_pg.2541_\